MEDGVHRPGLQCDGIRSWRVVYIDQVYSVIGLGRGGWCT